MSHRHAVPRRRWTPTLLGCAALALGWLVYAADRDPTRALLFPAFAALHTGPLFGAAGSWLPSFVHPFAISLLTAAAVLTLLHHRLGSRHGP